MDSGRSSVMSALAKAANKYRNSKQSTQSFVNEAAKAKQAHNEEAYKSTIKSADRSNLKSFLSKFTRNMPKGHKKKYDT
jgi:hypothetical protein